MGLREPLITDGQRPAQGRYPDNCRKPEGTVCPIPIS